MNETYLTPKRAEAGFPLHHGRKRGSFTSRAAIRGINLLRTSAAIVLVAMSQVNTPEARATSPGEPGKIAFEVATQVDPGALPIHLMNPDGSGPTKLVSASVLDGFGSVPAWSPDGRKLAFSKTGSSGLPSIFVVNVDGSGLKELTTSAHDYAPSWSPDGTKICFVRFASGSQETLWVMNADGTAEHEILSGSSSINRSPAWSPDGSAIAFSRTTASHYDIFTITPDGTGLTQITIDSSTNVQPSWSPDGAKIAFQSDQTGTDNIWVVNPDGTGETQLTTETTTADRSPSWSPNGSRILFAGHAAGNWDVYSMATDGTDQVQLTHTTRNEVAPSWQPLPIRLSASRSVIAYGHRVTLSIHLYFFDQTTNTEVSVFRTASGGAASLIATESVDSSGNLKISTKPNKNTTYFARWAGDSDHLAAQSPGARVGVRALVLGHLSKYYATSGKYRLYHYTSDCTKHGKGCPRYSVLVQPNHHGKRVSFTLQLHMNGAWRTVLSFRDRLDAHSKRTEVFVYRNASVIGIPSRVRGTFKGDADHLGGASLWSYFRISR
jgi:Tol biopolymer transport system component